MSGSPTRSQSYSRYYSVLTDQFLILQRKSPLSPSRKKYSRKWLDRLATPQTHVGKSDKPTIMELLREEVGQRDKAGVKKGDSGTSPFLSVTREHRNRKDETLPPGYYSPDYTVISRKLRVPSFKTNFKQASVFSRTRPPTPVDSCPKHHRSVAGSEAVASRPPTKLGFTSFAKMSSRTDMYLVSPGANEKRFENFDLYSPDHRTALRYHSHRRTRAFTKTANRPEVFKPTIEYMPDYTPNFEVVRSRMATYTFH